MLLTISTTHRPATDLGYLLHKAPGRVHRSELSFGEARVFYTEASEARCTAALHVDVDAVGLVRDRADQPLAAYVSDRPYAASSLLAVAIARAFGTALSGRSKEREALAETAIPLEARLSVAVPKGGERTVRALFEPLGWQVEIERIPLDAEHPEWGPGQVMRIGLRGEQKLVDLLSHLYVLLPALDGEQHYWVGEAEVEKLVRHGEGWLGAHPARELVVTRYLKHQRSLVRTALTALAPALDEADDAAAEPELELEKPISLDAQRRAFVVETLRRAGVESVVDLGCGEGKLVAELAREPWLARVVGVDVQARALERAADRVERLPEHARRKVELLTGSLLFRDARLVGIDAAACVEVVEHLEPERLDAFERALFVALRPRLVVLTTPNREHNSRFPGLAKNGLRHGDHRFEWTRAELSGWATAVAERRGYSVHFASVGEADDALGPPTQAAIFELPSTGKPAHEAGAERPPATRAPDRVADDDAPASADAAPATSASAPPPAPARPEPPAPRTPPTVQRRSRRRS